jgi:hypothetical protein
LSYRCRWEGKSKKAKGKREGRKQGKREGRKRSVEKKFCAPERVLTFAFLLLPFAFPLARGML